MYVFSSLAIPLKHYWSHMKYALPISSCFPNKTWVAWLNGIGTKHCIHLKSWYNCQHIIFMHPRLGWFCRLFMKFCILWRTRTMRPACCKHSAPPLLDARHRRYWSGWNYRGSFMLNDIWRQRTYTACMFTNTRRRGFYSVGSSVRRATINEALASCKAFWMTTLFQLKSSKFNPFYARRFVRNQGHTIVHPKALWTFSQWWDSVAL